MARCIVELLRASAHSHRHHLSDTTLRCMFCFLWLLLCLLATPCTLVALFGLLHCFSLLFALLLVFMCMFSLHPAVAPRVIVEPCVSCCPMFASLHASCPVPLFAGFGFLVACLVCSTRVLVLVLHLTSLALTHTVCKACFLTTSCLSFGLEVLLNQT